MAVAAAVVVAVDAAAGRASAGYASTPAGDQRGDERGRGLVMDSMAPDGALLHIDKLPDAVLAHVFEQLMPPEPANYIRNLAHCWRFSPCKALPLVCKRWRCVEASYRSNLSVRKLDHLPALIERLPGVTNMHLCPYSYQDVSGALESLTAAYPRLRHITLSYSTMSDAALKCIASRCRSLERITITRTKGLTSSGLLALVEGGAKLDALQLDGCVGVTSEVLHAIAKHLPHLQLLSIANCQDVTDDGVEGVAAGCHKLRELSLEGCNTITASCLTRIARELPRTLRCINLAECANVTDGLLHQLEGLLPQGCEIFGWSQPIFDL
eukprot:jgi/Chlat1/827/Chrsp104S01171